MMRACVADVSCSKIHIVDQLPIPILRRPNQVLVKVQASSINPIDTKIADGYGNRLIKTLNQCAGDDISNQRILGRDFVGIVQTVGPAVRKIKVNERVYGMIPATRDGALAEYTIANDCELEPVPQSLSSTSLAAVPYSGCTAWIALCGRVKKSNAKYQNILVHNGSGGIGTLLLQLLYAWKAKQVVATAARPQSLAQIEKYGAIPINRVHPDALRNIAHYGPYDIIIDAANSVLSQQTIDFLYKWQGSSFVTMLPPVLKDTNDYGIAMGSAFSAFKYLQQALPLAKDGRSVSWIFVQPSRSALRCYANLMQNNLLQPVIERIISLDECPDAMHQISNRQSIGKTIVTIN